MNKAKVVGGLIVAILLTATMTGCGSSEPEVTQPQYTTVPVERGDVIRTIYAPGELIPTDTLTLSSPVDSELLELRVKPGEKVNKGDILAHLDISEWDKELTALERDVLQAEINLANAELALEKVLNQYTDEEIEEKQDEIDDAEEYVDFAKKQLKQARREENELEERYWHRKVYQAKADLAALEDELVEMLYPPDERDAALRELEVELAEAKLEDAKEALEEAFEESTDILAPCDSTVLDIKFREGDMVTRDSPIIVLADLNQMELMATVGQDKITSIRPGMSADIILDALPGTTFKGKVGYVVPQKSPTSQTVTYEVYVSLDEVAEGLLPGMTGGATILVTEKHDVLRMSRRLVKIAPDGSGRVEVLEQGQPVVKEVVIGVRGDSYYEIISGLAEGDLVIQKGRF